MPTLNLDDQSDIEQQLIHRHSAAGRRERWQRRWRMRSHKYFLKIGLFGGVAAGPIAAIVVLYAWRFGAAVCEGAAQQH